MAVTPRISLVAYGDRNPDFIFVSIPDQRGRYLRTDKSVAFVECPACHAAVGEPCRTHTQDGYQGTTHVWRRSAFSAKHWGKKADDVLEKPVLPEPVPDEWMEASA